MRRSHILLTAALVLLGTRAFAQEPMSPYGDEPTPSQAAPIQPMQAQPLPPVPPPLVVPPPGGYYQQPYQQQYQQPYGQQQQYYYQQPTYAMQPPRLFHEEMQPNYGLVVAGVVILGASWSINAASAYLADEWKLAVPVVGPFMETQNINTGLDATNRMLVGLLVFDGLIETAGAIMIVAGAVTHHKVRIYDAPRVSVVPTAGPAGGGLAAFGRF